MSEMESMLENNSELFSCYVANTAPFAIRDVISLSDCRVLSITVPVYKTLNADANGDFLFTISVVGNSSIGLQNVRRKYEIKINGAEYGISANNNSVFKFIKIDLREYGIVLAADETMAFFGANDTLYPAYIYGDNDASSYWKKNAPQAIGFSMRTGTSFISWGTNCLVYNFELERTYDSIEEKNEATSGQPFTVVETYVDPDVMSEMASMLESNSSLFSSYVTGSAPFAIRDVIALSDCRVLSITVPVYKTLNADADGNFLFTISVVGNSATGLQKTLRKYEIKVNGADHGITANDDSVFKVIKIDLREYNIVLAADETMAFFGANDTLYPAYIYGDNDASNYWKKNAPQAIGFSMRTGTSSMSWGTNCLIYNFELERTYDSFEEKKAATSYADKLEAVKKAYSGKKLSILGDSISTYSGISNNTSYNSTIGSNAVYYPTTTKSFPDHTTTYWGRLLRDLSMTLCVDNAWSGSRVYGQSGTSYKDRMPTRATQLHNNNGETPDLIIVYMGINDLHNLPSSQYGDLYNLLKNSTTQESDRKIVAEWFAAVKARSNSNPGFVAGTSYTTWEQAYALALDAMINRYPDAEIYCLTLLKNNDSRCTNEKITIYNRCIRALTDYFGIGLVDQERYGYITPDNCHIYCGDNDASSLHPFPNGHALMEKFIVETLYENLEK